MVRGAGSGEGFLGSQPGLRARGVALDASLHLPGLAPRALRQRLPQEGSLRTRELLGKCLARSLAAQEAFSKC